MALLFCISLTPITTEWLGPHLGQVAPTAVYGMVQLLSAGAYFALTRSLLRIHSPDSRLAQALGNDVKGKLSGLAYAVAIGIAFVAPYAALAIYIGVAVVWFVPDRRITRVTGAGAADRTE